MDRDSAGFVSFALFVFKKFMSFLVLNTDFTNSPNVDGWGVRRVRAVRAPCYTWNIPWRMRIEGVSIEPFPPPSP